MPAKKKTAGELSIELLRHQLASINLSDVKEEEMSETERKDYNAAIFAVWPRLEKDLKQLMHTQLMFASQEALIWEQTIFGRGTFNGLDLVYEKWKAAAEAHKPEPKEDFDEHNPLPEI